MGLRLVKMLKITDDSSMTSMIFEISTQYRRARIVSNQELLDKSHDGPLSGRMAADRYWPMAALDPNQKSTSDRYPEGSIE